MPADPEVERYLRALVDEAQGVLGAELLGAYAAGSVALDAYQPGRSDIDAALVCASSLDEATKQELVQRLRHESLPCPARGLELVVYREEVARSGVPEPGFELELNSGPAMPFRATLRPEDRPVEHGHFWYGLDRAILHQSGLALLGPPAADVFAEPGPEDVRDLLTAALRWWLDHTRPGSGPTPGADDAVLGACRTLVRLRSGRWLAKAAAGRYLIGDGHEAADLVHQAIEARRGGTLPTGDRAREFQQQVLRELTADNR